MPDGRKPSREKGTENGTKDLDNIHKCCVDKAQITVVWVAKLVATRPGIARKSGSAQHQSTVHTASTKLLGFGLDDPVRCGSHQCHPQPVTVYSRNCSGRPQQLMSAMRTEGKSVMGDLTVSPPKTVDC
jgi:hypothetical protein